MSIRGIMLKYLGWCPGFDSVVKFLSISTYGFSMGFGARLILFILLFAAGLQYLISIYSYWFVRVPQFNISPFFRSQWKQFSDVLWSLGALFLMALATDIWSSGKISTRHRKELAAALITFGIAKSITTTYYGLVLIPPTGIRLGDIIDIFVPNIWNFGIIYAGYRLLLAKPLTDRPTLILFTVSHASRIIRLLLVNPISLPLTVNVNNAHYMFNLLSTFPVLIFLVNGIRGKWSVQSILKEGLSRYLKAGIFLYGLNYIVVVIEAFLFEPQSIAEAFGTNLGKVSIFLNLLGSLSIIGVSVYPWNTLKGEI